MLRRVFLDGFVSLFALPVNELGFVPSAFNRVHIPLIAPNYGLRLAATFILLLPLLCYMALHDSLLVTASFNS